MLDEQLRIAEATCGKFSESVRVLRAMMDAGMANDVAVSQMEGAWYQVESLTNALTKTEKMMQYTSTTYLEVLTAQQSLLEAETSRAQDMYEKISAVVELYRALGGGQQ